MLKTCLKKLVNTASYSQKYAQKLYQGKEGLEYVLSTFLPDLPKEEKDAIFRSSMMVPFRTNNHIVENLINWDNYKEDPIFRLTVPSPGMLDEREHQLLIDKGEKEGVKAVIDIWNPYGSMQNYNVPKLMLNGEEIALEGLQHKYETTCLFFPTAAQQCFSYCTYCFRWAQFHPSLIHRFEMEEPYLFFKYLESKKDLTDVLITGGDPGTLSAKNFKKILEPFISEKAQKKAFGETIDVSHIQNIRIGTRALTYWPYRFTSDPDAKELLELFKKVNDSGHKRIYIMCHIGHYQEMGEEMEKAVRNLKEAGCMLRSQSPVVRGINDKPEIWQKKWNKESLLGITPYYMFIARDTGPKKFFEIPLYEVIDIYNKALNNVSGLAKSVRGPSMSAGPGKVCIRGINEIKGEKVFTLQFLQGRNKEWCSRLFNAEYDEKATFLDHLKPAFGEEKFFFEDELKEWKSGKKHW